MTINDKRCALLQKIFRYADPLMVAVETVEQLGIPDAARDIVNSSLWWNVLLTTRILVAHATMLVDAHDQMCSTVATNFRALLRLVNVDIATKESFASTQASNTVWYKVKEGKKLWLPLKKGSAAILGQLTSSTYQDIQSEFDDMVNQASDEDVQFNLHRVQQVFGHAVFQLVATRDNDWKKLAAKYATPPVL